MYGVCFVESALNGKHGDVVEFLNSKGGHIDSRRQSSLVKRMLAACMQGDIKEIERVLMAGCSMQDADQDGRTPLHLAASEGQVQAVMFCLKKGADVNALDRFGNTPLSAARRGMGRLHQ
jgi:ankyrin repeat protein